MTYALGFTAHHRHPNSSIWDLVPGKPGKTPLLPSLAGGMSPPLWLNVAFSGQGDSILTQHTICLCCKMVKFDRFLFPLTSNVTMSHRPYPATEFTSVNFSTTEMSRFIMCSKNFPSSYCEFLTSNIFWCLLLRSHRERRRKERREGIFWCTGEMK